MISSRTMSTGYLPVRPQYSSGCHGSARLRPPPRPDAHRPAAAGRPPLAGALAARARRRDPRARGRVRGERCARAAAAARRARAALRARAADRPLPARAPVSARQHDAERRGRLPGAHALRHRRRHGRAGRPGLGAARPQPRGAPGPRTRRRTAGDHRPARRRPARGHRAAARCRQRLATRPELPGDRDAVAGPRPAAVPEPRAARPGDDGRLPARLAAARGLGRAAPRLCRAVVRVRGDAVRAAAARLDQAAGVRVNGAPVDPSPRAVLRRRVQLLLIAALFVGPVALAFWSYYGLRLQPRGRANHGVLIEPARPLPAVPLRTHGGWSMLYVADGACDAACRATLDVMRQVRAALGAETARVQRVLLVSGACCDPLAAEAAGEELIVAHADGEASIGLLAVFPKYGAPVADARRVYLVDPLGNLLMSYVPGAPPEGMIKDLERLLRLSHIG